jgi:hypothetical protein
MTYEQAVQWLFDAVPNFQRDGGTKDYKIGLDGPKALWEALHFPGKLSQRYTLLALTGRDQRYIYWPQE